jgi:hypothetical protein
METYSIENLEERFGETQKSYAKLGVKTEMEKGDGSKDKHLWGKNLSLSLVDTIKYAENIADFFVPSAALLADIYIHCLQNDKDPSVKTPFLKTPFLRLFDTQIAADTGVVAS